MTERIINTEDDLELWIKFLRARKLPQTVSTIDGRDRSGQQNQLQFLWASEAAHQRGDVTTEEVRHDWKLRHGVPILREDSAEFREVYDKAIKPLPYELKVMAMAYFPVTSEMKVRQMVRYLDTIQRECAEQGIRLTEPDPDLAKHQSRYRDRQEAA